MRKNLHWLWLSIFVILIDQMSKQVALTQLDFGQSIPLLPFFKITLNYNTGAAFSFLQGAGGWQRWLFSIVSIIVSVVIIVWIYRLPRRSTLPALALALILGGALGNLWDRLHYGFVIDFFHVFYNNWHFPIFNVADSAITVGAILLILHVLIHTNKVTDDGTI